MDTSKIFFLEKIDRIKDAELNSDLAYIIQQLNVWSKAKPKNEDLKKMIKAFMNCYGIMQSYQTDRQMYHKALSELRSDKLRAVERARRSENAEEVTAKDGLSNFIENNENK